MRTLRVIPAPGGWAVDNDLTGMPLLFTAGAHAERAARLLAHVIAEQGEQAEVIIHDLRGSIAGSIVVGPGRP
jgi:hypothetical protein